MDGNEILGIRKKWAGDGVLYFAGGSRDLLGASQLARD